MLCIDLGRTTERPLTTYYLLLSTIIILKKTMYLLCTDYVPKSLCQNTLRQNSEIKQTLLIEDLLVH